MTDTNNAAALVHVQGVSRHFGEGDALVRAVDGIDLHVPAGQMVVLMGPSGSGKTTLLNLIGGLDRPTKGRITYDGTDIAAMSSRQQLQWRRRDLGFIFQAFALLPALSAVENVELSLHIAGVPPKRRREQARMWLDHVGLGKRQHQSVLQLSGGEQQRVAIARALAHSPRLVLADEPTGQLDVNTALGVLALLRHTVDTQGTTVCMVTHDHKAQQFADVTHSLMDGRIKQEKALGGPTLPVNQTEKDQNNQGAASAQ